MLKGIFSSNMNEIVMVFKRFFVSLSFWHTVVVDQKELQRTSEVQQLFFFKQTSP